MVNTSGLIVGSILESRYQVVRELGRGGFGRTYLAIALNQAREYCVLKEFAPQVQGANELQKAKELFEREAGVLYKLQHPQIPRFRELLKVKIEGTETLFLVQDYIEGKTYFDLLKSYRQSDRRFSEAEVTQLLKQLLPVLDYIHAQGVVHRDISPDNLIQRSFDGLPVLIDFGGVKQVAATVVSLYSRLSPPTRIGKAGYAPDEQMIRGTASPSSDLYALGVTAVVLLTGKEPHDLYDAAQAAWEWRKFVNISPTLARVLERMLAYRPSDRYQSATEVIQALQDPDPLVSQMRTVNVLGGTPEPVYQSFEHNNPDGTVVISPPVPDLWQHRWKTIAVSLGIALFTSVAAWTLFNPGGEFWNAERMLRSQPEMSLSQIEQARRNSIIKRCQALKMSHPSFIRQVDRRFHARHPELMGRSLSDRPEDARLRNEWYEIAESLLDRLER